MTAHFPRFTSRLLIHSLWLSSAIGFMTGIALGQDSVATPSLETPAKTSLPDKFVADGSRVAIDTLGISIVPPTGWEVLANSPSLSLVMQEPAPEKIEYNKAIYQKNITVAAVHTPAPIDEQRAASLSTELMNTFGKQGVISEYQVSPNHKFFDYQAKNDGLVVFATFKTGEFNMMQMHVLVSGADAQFLVTYTDLAERFSEQTAYALAWNSMVSLQVTGAAPKRYENLYIGGGIAAVLMLLLGSLIVWRRRSQRLTFLSEADDVVYGGDNAGIEFKSSNTSSGRAKVDHVEYPATQTGIWNLANASNHVRSIVNERLSSAKEEGFSFVTGL